MKPRVPTQQGFSMIEVLIAIVVLAIGLLGFALLQTTNLRYTQSANNRTLATNLAYSLLDQMRTNRLSAADYAGAGFAANTLSIDSCEAPVGTAVQQGIATWQCQVFNALGPTARAEVSYDGSGVATVTPGWGERGGNEPETEFQARTQL